MAIKRAKMAFAWQALVNGRRVPRVVTSGMLFDEEDEVVQRFPQHFEGVEVHVDRRREARARVEQATSEPGEKRSVSPPKSKRRRRSEPEPEPTVEEQQAHELGLVDPDATE